MEETWSTLTAAEVLEEFTSQEKESFDAVKGDDTLAAVVARVIDQVRDSYRSGGRPLGDEGTIPDGVKLRAISMARWKFLIALPEMKQLQTENRRRAHDDAEAWLNLIARREVGGSGAAQLVGGNTRQFTRSKLSGL